MNGRTNVQLTAIATFLVAVVLGLGRYYAPGLIESFGSSFPEIFTGGVIGILGYLLKEDAGIKSLPGTGGAK